MLCTVTDRNPVTITAYVAQVYANQLRRIAESAPHRILVTSIAATMVVEGPSRIPVNGSAQLRAVVTFARAASPAPQLQYTWTDQNSGLRLGSSSALTVTKAVAGSYPIKVEAYAVAQGTRTKVAEASRVVIVEDVQRATSKPATPIDDRKAPPAINTPPPASTDRAEADWVAEYRSLLPGALAVDKKPWQTKVEILSNAEQAKPGQYKVNYRFYCLVEQGPDKGKEYVCSEFEGMFDLEQVKSAVLAMRARGKK